MDESVAKLMHAAIGSQLLAREILGRYFVRVLMSLVVLRYVGGLWRGHFLTSGLHFNAAAGDSSVDIYQPNLPD
jgi:hypothetical protein